MVTPFNADLSVDFDTLAAHAAAMLDRGADGVTLFGTTGEGASISEAERADGLAALLKAGIPADRITLCLYANAADDAVRLVRESVARGVTSFLAPPPFFYPAPEDEGLHGWYARVIGQSDPAARFILYHIPQVTGVALSAALVARLAGEFPSRIRAVKDSSGDWPTAERFLGIKGLSVLVGDERLLHRAVALGGAGSITGCANLYPERLKQVVETGQEDPGLSAIITSVNDLPVIGAIKVLVARAANKPGWEALRPPLTPLDAAGRDSLLNAVPPDG